MNKAQVIVRVVIKARCDTPKVLQPCVKAFDLSSATIKLNRSAVLSRLFLPVAHSQSVMELEEGSKGSDDWLTGLFFINSFRYIIVKG